jgi:hypothetical protein
MSNSHSATPAKSIHCVLRENCREALYVPPLLWVQRHLDLLDCSFVQDDSLIPSTAPQRPGPASGPIVDDTPVVFDPRPTVAVTNDTQFWEQPLKAAWHLVNGIHSDNRAVALQTLLEYTSRPLTVQVSAWLSSLAVSDRANRACSVPSPSISGLAPSPILVAISLAARRILPSWRVKAHSVPLHLSSGTLSCARCIGNAMNFSGHRLRGTMFVCATSPYTATSRNDSVRLLRAKSCTTRTWSPCSLLWLNL